jgi:hypothetical protein
VVPYTDAHWRTFFQIAGRPELQDDPRFTTLESRLANIEVLYEELGRIVATRTSAEWLEALESASVPATVVNTLESLLADPQLEATGFWKVVEHPSEGTLRMPDIPTTYSRTPGEIRRLQPRLGEHSVEVLGEAGFSRPEIDAILASGAHGPVAMRTPERLALSRDILGLTVGPFAHDIDARWLMAYAAGLGETDPRYYDTHASGGPAAHPLFPVCYEWPSMVALRERATPEAIALRGVHAHDLTLSHASREDRLSPLRVTGLAHRRAGTLMTVRQETVDAEGRPVSTTGYGSVYRDVGFEGEDSGFRPEARGGLEMPAGAVELPVALPPGSPTSTRSARASGTRSTPTSPSPAAPGSLTSSSTAPPPSPSPSPESSSIWPPTPARCDE